jgi:hypothetical protein
MFHGTWEAYSEAERRHVLSELAAHGETTVRIDVAWAMVQPDNAHSFDPWGVGMVDNVIHLANHYGLKPLVMLWDTPGWANDNAGVRALPTHPAAYGRIASWFAKRYRGEVSGWEVWNEENSSDFMTGASASAYAQLLKAAYPAFKRADPNTPVVFGGLQYVDVAWAKQVMDDGAAKDFDVMGVHPYMGLADASPLLADDGTIWNMRHVKVLHQMLKAEGRTHTPIWFTEFGWSAVPTAPGAPNWDLGVSQRQQALYLKQTVALVERTMPYVHRLFWYDDWRGLETGYLHGYGMVEDNGAASPVLRELGRISTGSARLRHVDTAVSAAPAAPANPSASTAQAA